MHSMKLFADNISHHSLQLGFTLIVLHLKPKTMAKTATSSTTYAQRIACCAGCQMLSSPLKATIAYKHVPSFAALQSIIQMKIKQWSMLCTLGSSGPAMVPINSRAHPAPGQQPGLGLLFIQQYAGLLAAQHQCFYCLSPGRKGSTVFIVRSIPMAVNETATGVMLAVVKDGTDQYIRL